MNMAGKYDEYNEMFETRPRQDKKMSAQITTDGAHCSTKVLGI